MFTLAGSILHFETATQSVTLENGLITSLRSKATGKEYVSCKGGDVPLIAHWRGVYGDPYPDNERYPLDTGEVSVRLLSDTYAELVFHSWYGDGVMLLWEDAETGDLCVRPSVSSGRPGVKAAGWELRGISDELYAVVPTFQGARLKLDDPMLAGSKLNWPLRWEIGLCVFESDAGDGFWVHCRDDRYIYKDLHFGEGDKTGCIELLTEAYGPLDNNYSAGGLVWRVNCFEGGWRTPAAIYRKWYYEAYDLEKERANRQPWLKDIRMAVCWQDCRQTDFLKNLAKMVDPNKVLIHLATWRDAQYDQEYPDYWPSKQAEAYIKLGSELGFHICPHMNSEEVDSSHAIYPMVSSFQMQNIDSRTVYGWGYSNEFGYLGVPWTEFAKRDPRNREYNIMSKIHAGSSLWQHELYTRMEKVAETYPIAGCFIDVSLCTYNLHNALVEGITSSEGLKEMIRLLSRIRGGMPIGGEGLNEITAQTLSFAQMHLYKSEISTLPGLERCGGDVAINDFIYGDLCFTIGYNTLSGKTEDEVMRSRIHDDHNTVPTFICWNSDDILHPNPTVQSIIEKAK